MKRVSQQQIIDIAHRIGLRVLGATSAEPPPEEAIHLKEWQERGYAGEMSYMLRPVALLSDPRRLLPSAKSILLFAVNYSRAIRQELPPGYGRVARYAWGRDYHRILKSKLKTFMESVKLETGLDPEYRVFSDAVPLIERSFAARAGLGFIGKNSMLIKPRVGSFFFIAEVVWDVEITENSLQVLDENCGDCTRCIESCPTDAIVSDRVVDAKRCISYLTIEKRGALPEWERKAIGEWVFGCDVCQDVCPFNHTVLKQGLKADLSELDQESGVGQMLDLGKVMSYRTDSMFQKQFAGTALMRTKREGLLRNAAIVAANTRAEQHFEIMLKAAREDSSALVRQHALWGACQLAQECNLLPNDKIKSFLEGFLLDGERDVRDEAQILLENCE